MILGFVRTRNEFTKLIAWISRRIWNVTTWSSNFEDHRQNSLRAERGVYALLLEQHRLLRMKLGHHGDGETSEDNAAVGHQRSLTSTAQY